MKARTLSPHGQHVFFGYYDLQPWNASATRHLAHRVLFIDRLPGATDTAELGWLDQAGAFTPVAATTAWNFQQGAMLQWHPAAPDTQILFNVRDGDAYRGCVLRLEDGSRRMLERPVATVDSAGSAALSVSFPRMFDFRPGYGYAGVADPFRDQNHPREDGVFLVELASGSSRLLLSLDELWELTREHADGGDQKVLINHISWNVDGSRFLLLLRYRRDSSQGGGWRTAMVTARRDGKGARVLMRYGYASHYHWRDSDTLAVHSDGPVGPQLYEAEVSTGTFGAVDPEFFLRDGHCSYSPDRRFMLYDSYPDSEGSRRLWVYDLAGRRGRDLGPFFSPPEITGDIRCDLHPRWDRTGGRISFDSLHEGFRGIYEVDAGRS